MKDQTAKSSLSRRALIACGVVFACIRMTGILSAQSAQSKPASTPVVPPETFATPEAAADALIDAAEKFDEAAIAQIFGSEGKDLMITAEPARDRETAGQFAALAHEKKAVSIDPKNKNHALMILGNEDWPFAIPIVRKGGKWSFDSAAGREELLYRRIGTNELDAIQLCLGYVEAQNDYALEKHDGSEVNQYARRVISSPGRQDGLAWKTADGKWEGPIGENIANAIEKGYTADQPYHGYFFKSLKGQGAAARLGEMDFVVKGVMIGGFALVAAPAEYRVTGVKTFIVSNDGVVYEKDLGPDTLEQFKKMELFNPDKTWSPVKHE